MEKMIVTKAHTGDAGGGKEKRFEKGDPITVTNETADRLRAAGLARKAPATSAEDKAPAGKAEADETAGGE